MEYNQDNIENCNNKHIIGASLIPLSVGLFMWIMLLICI